MNSDLYQKSYGGWAGSPDGQRPDYTRCCIEVGRPLGRTTMFGQCLKPRGHGPDGAYCKIHDPDAVKARQAKQHSEYVTKHNKRREEWYGPEFLAALRKIAAGHNDPRALAAEVIATFEAGAAK